MDFGMTDHVFGFFFAFEVESCFFFKFPVKDSLLR